MENKEIEQLATAYLNTLKVVSNNEFNSIPLAYVKGFEKAQELHNKTIETLFDLIEKIQGRENNGSPIDNLINQCLDTIPTTIKR